MKVSTWGNERISYVSIRCSEDKFIPADFLKNTINIIRLKIFLMENSINHTSIELSLLLDNMTKEEIIRLSS